MARLMSVAMTEDAVVDRVKSVTRRANWWRDRHGRPIITTGDHLTLCRKVMGRRPGEPLVRLADVEVLDVSRETLRVLSQDSEYAWAEVALEGFPDMHPVDFVQGFFLDAQRMSLTDVVTRIEWRYLDEVAS